MDFVFYLTNHFHETEYDLEEATVTSFCCQFNLLMKSDGKNFAWLSLKNKDFIEKKEKDLSLDVQRTCYIKDYSLF